MSLVNVTRKVPGRYSWVVAKPDWNSPDYYIIDPDRMDVDILSKFGLRVINKSFEYHPSLYTPIIYGYLNIRRDSSADWPLIDFDKKIDLVINYFLTVDCIYSVDSSSAGDVLGPVGQITIKFDKDVYTEDPNVLNESLVNVKSKNIKITGDFPNGEWQKKQYDDRGNWVYKETDDGTIIQNEYNENNQLTKTTTSYGYWFEARYDDRGLEIYKAWGDREGDFDYWQKTMYNKWGQEIRTDSIGDNWSETEYDKNGNKLYYRNSSGYVENLQTGENNRKELQGLSEGLTLLGCLSDLM
jgi:hypothetical protein